MEIDLTDDQRMLQETTRKFLESAAPMRRVRELLDDDLGFDRDLWAQAADLGWFSLLVPEGDGGGSVSGSPVVDASMIAEEIGRAVFPGPVLPANLVAQAIAASGSAVQRQEHLPGLVAGTTIATWALAEATDRWSGEGVEMAAVAEDGAFRLSGTKAVVQDAHAAHLLLVTARTTQGLTQFLVPAGLPGVTITPLRSLDLARRFSDVRFDDVRVPADAVLGEVGRAADAVERQLDVAVALQCAESVGALDRCYEMTLDYAKTRKAFGRAIGSFQALKHRFADMALWLESAKAVTAAAATAVDHDVDRAEMVSIAKAYVGDRGPAIVRDCLQLHGGIGYTWEFDLHFYLRRVESNAALYGNPDHHRDRLAAIVGL